MLNCQPKALDEEAERRMYELVRERLPGATVLSIAHRSGAFAHHQRQLLVDGKKRRADVSEVVG